VVSSLLKLNNMITAKEAAERVESMTTEVAKSQMEKIHKAVDLAVDKAQRQAYVGFLIVPSVKAELEKELGYTVKLVDDIREGCYTIIGW